MASGAKVIIVGAGIAGPVLATLLKIKRYAPVVYERTSGVGDRGIGHGVSSNGLAVLAKVPGLLDTLESAEIEKMMTYSTVEGDEGLMLSTPVSPPPPGRHRSVGVRRSALHHAIINMAQKHGVEIKWDHKLVGLQQHEDFVTVKFDNGSEDTASFVVGSDGLHSNTRSCLFGEQKADYTGLSQTGGITLIPESLKGPHSLINVFGDGAHVIALPVSSTHMGWAMTQREPESMKETWNTVNNILADEIRNSPVAAWDYGISELIKSTERITKYGLYDRPELKAWHKGRVILIGDAAHPTSPHLGQGANQALEDVDMLADLLEKHNPSSAPPSTETLETVFTEMEAERIPRSSALVKGARRQGEARVVSGVDACLKRNQQFREIWKDEESVRRWRSGN
ncbi:hypothetical protein BC835DRAFT_1408199 [Cytidiella melzeri]|nr:hypothetical protein BC835DRAFT_1408199 [Cytidiella melzeri]